MKKRLLFISNLFPNPLFPNRATFNRQQVDALREFYHVDIIAPIPWTELAQQRRLASLQLAEASGIYHPLYWYPPGCLRTTYGECYYHSIKSTAQRLLERNSYDLIYSSWLYPDGYAAARLAEEYRLPLFAQVVGSDVNLLTAGSVLKKESLAVTSKARRVICVSKALQDRLLRLGCEPDKAVVVYNGINKDIFRSRPRHEVRRELGIDQSEKLILFVGNLIKEKGLAELIAAFGMLTSPFDKGGARGISLAIIGSGSYEGEVRRMIAALPDPGRVCLLGSLPLERVAVWMNAASLLCLPSYMEGLPNVVLEALASGTPVVATRVGGIPELDRGDGSLVLVEPRTVEPLAEALRDMLDRGDVDVDSSFIGSWQETAAQLVEIFEA